MIQFKYFWKNYGKKIAIPYYVLMSKLLWGIIAMVILAQSYVSFAVGERMAGMRSKSEDFSLSSFKATNHSLSPDTALGLFDIKGKSFALKETPRKIIIPNSTVSGNSTLVLVFDNPGAHILSQAKIYDLMGQEVADFREETPAGNDPIRLTWDGRDKNGSIVRGGIYIYQVQAESQLINGTVVVAR